MTGVQENQDVYFSSFQELENAPQQPWLQRLRRAAMDRFADLGFPTTRLEEWKFTSVAPIVQTSFQAAQAAGLPAGELEKIPLAGLGYPRLTFVNGYFSPRLSQAGDLPKGVYAGSLAAALEEGNSVAQEHLARYARYQDHAFVALNTALLRDGAFIEIPKGIVLDRPIHLLFLKTASEQPAVSCPRVLLVIGRDSQAGFIESHLTVGGGVHFTNAVTEIAAGENAIVDHYKLQMENRRSFHVAAVQAHQDRSSAFHSYLISQGGALVRNDINSVLDGEGGECVLNGLYIAKDGQHVDNHTTLDHARPHCSSREIYKGILDGRAAAVFNGRIIVRKDAQKTDAKQTNKNLLLSEEASINTKPQLEIYADDVKCTHGATVGQLGEELLFYLRSRGIGNEEARRLLTYAFAGDIVERIKFQPLRSRLDGLLLSWLRKETI